MRRKGYKSFLVSGIIFLLFLSAIVVNEVAAGSYPEKDILWIVPYRAGGGYDTYARIIAQYLGKYLPNNVSVGVKNMKGAGGITGVSTLYKSRPDGYTIGWAAYPGMAVAKMTMDLGFDPEALTPIAQIAVSPQALFVGGKSNIKSINDLKKIKAARFGTTSKGASMYSFSMVASKTLGLDSDLVTGYGGTSAVVPAIIRGDVEGAVLNLTRLKKYLESGDLRAIVTFTSQRHPLTPNVPCVSELGADEATVVKDYKILFAPPKLPNDRFEILQKAVVSTVKDSEIAAWSKKSSMPLDLKTGTEMMAEINKIKDVYGKYKALLK
jgi:tripartite-type tricarboxylate transporter receptor subunit TctC